MVVIDMQCADEQGIRNIYVVRCLGLVEQAHSPKDGGQKMVDTGWRRLIGCLKLWVIFRKSATNYRALLQKVTYEDTASYDSMPPCITCKRIRILVISTTNIIYVYTYIIHIFLYTYMFMYMLTYTIFWRYGGYHVYMNTYYMYTNDVYEAVRFSNL